MKTKQYFMYLFRKFQWMIANIVAVLVFSVLLQKFFAPDPAAISPDSYILSPTQAYPKDIPVALAVYFPNFMTLMAWGNLAGLVFEGIAAYRIGLLGGVGRKTMFRMNLLWTVLLLLLWGGGTLAMSRLTLYPEMYFSFILPSLESESSSAFMLTAVSVAVLFALAAIISFWSSFSRRLFSGKARFAPAIFGSLATVIAAFVLVAALRSAGNGFDVFFQSLNTNSTALIALSLVVAVVFWAGSYALFRKSQA